MWEKTVAPTDITWATIVEALESPIVEENKLARDIVQWLTRCYYGGDNMIVTD